MADIKSYIEKLDIDADDATISAIFTQLSENKSQAMQASAIHIDF